MTYQYLTRDDVRYRYPTERPHDAEIWNPHDKVWERYRGDTTKLLLEGEPGAPLSESRNFPKLRTSNPSPRKRKTWARAFAKLKIR